MAQIIRVVLLVTLLAEHGISDARCRFDTSSTIRGPCIFPCRCTAGCDQVTGQCVKDGHCNDGPPGGYRWSGPACQIGNIALHKKTEQSTTKWGDMYLSNKSVDGSVDPLSYQHCAVPNATRGTNAWWKIDFGGNYKLFRVTIYNTNTVFVEAPHCPAIAMYARDRCGDVGINQLQCQAQGCCWDDEARNSDIACYRKECKAGYFGWRCRFQCYTCPTCDRITGKCPVTCKDDRWGVGCMLNNNCYYNNWKGVRYMGRKKLNNCRAWTLQIRKLDAWFPDGSRAAAQSYCRNPDDDQNGPWCFIDVKENYHYCNIRSCNCDVGRFGVSCVKECHCTTVNENCQTNSPQGRCNSGCASHFTGQTCQECEDDNFGVSCDGTCHCRSGGCDKKTGYCTNGCAAGWSGDNCQTDERRLSAFTLSVGNRSDGNDHTQCASHNGAVAAGATVSESCTATGRYLSFRRSGGGENHLTTLCEVVVIGHRYISCQRCPKKSTCDDVIGCGACAPGKQQPDCKNDCDDGYYGVNCNESCGHCKEQSKCAITTGNCSNGCETWYTSDVCRTYIATPDFPLSVKPDVAEVTSSSITVSWPKATNISPGIEGHYYYVLWLKAGGETERNVTRVEQGAGEQRIEAQVTRLTFDTKYALRVESYREHNGKREAGASTATAVFQTAAKAGGLSAGGAAGVSIGVILVLAGISVVVIVVFLRRRRMETVKTEDIAIGDVDHGMEDGAQGNVNFDYGNETEDEDDADTVAVVDTSRIYMNVQQVTRGIKVADLAAYFEDNRRRNGFQKEFAELPSGARAECSAAKTQENKNKNRFVNIIAYDDTRVVLSSDNGQSDYINASHIKGYKDEENAYIATQGPKPWTIEDMWRMVWQEKTNTIVMLANIYELGKEKCSRYWPLKRKTETWGHFIVESTNEEQFADYVIREFTLKNQELTKLRRIRQLHFTAWPDKGTPDYTYPLLAFHRKVHSFDSQRRGPLLVHCSAGVGRTGTLIAIDILTQQAAAEGKVDVLQCVDLLRTQRMDMVQTLAQYVFVFQALVDTSEVSVISCSQLQKSFDELSKGTNLYKQFERLNALMTLPKNQRCAALEPKNVNKNRNIEIIPEDQHRPYLLTPWKEGTNYINAVTVHGYKQRNAYILTQSPMTTTVVDLWRLLNDHESRTVVMLDDIDDTDSYAIYWPNKKEPKCQYGPFEVELTETNISENPNVTMRDFKLTKPSKPDDSAVIVRQFHLKKNTWNKKESVPSNKTVLLDLLDLVEKWQQQSGNGPITMHCSDGASRCGMLVAASYILEHLKIEQEVDVFHAVQHVRTTRPQLVSHLEQYRFLYQVALAYMSQFDMYANFQ